MERLAQRPARLSGGRALPAAGRQACVDGHRHRECREHPARPHGAAVQRPDHPQPGAQELQEYLALPEPPLRIECIDISTLQGQDTVASLVVFEDGLPRKRDYRSFIIRTPGADDTAAVAEVVSRRFGNQSATTTEPTADEAMPGTTEPRRFAYPPALLVIDGGAPQVRAAQDALMAVGMSDLPVIGLAKRLEEVWLPDEADPVIMPRTSEGLYLLQRVRDEAHRTAIGLHRKRRGKRATVSALDAVPGLGPARAKALLSAFGSMRAVKAASIEQLQGVPGIGPSLATAVHEQLHPSDVAGADADRR